MKEILHLSDRIFQYKLDGFIDCIKKSNQVADVVERHLSNSPFHLNVIEAACHGRFKETGHSLVLADMLKHPLIQFSFLESFLNIQSGCLMATAETDRVDVALKGDDIFVIIENKVNAAQEQKNQVYRYVHDIGIDKYGYDLSQIYVIYLNPYNRIPPSAYSLCEENNQNNVFNELGEDHYTIQSYKYDVTSWLRGLSIENEPHIASALDQYIDFLENKFHTSQSDKAMNKEIKELLLKELQIENISAEKQIEALDMQASKINELLASIDELKADIRKRASHEQMISWQNEIENQHGVRVQHDEHSFGIQLKNKVWLGIWDGYDADDYFPYWGFQLSSYKEGNCPEVESQIRDVIRAAGIEKFRSSKGWVAWNTTKEGVERFMSLYRCAQEADLVYKMHRA